VAAVHLDVDLVQVPRAVEQPVQRALVGQLGADAIAQLVVAVAQQARLKA